MRRAVGRLGDAIAAVCQLGAGFCLVLMTGVVIHAVIARYLLGSAPAWSEELPRLLLIWGALLGAVIAERKGSHLTAGVFPLLVENSKVRQANAALVTVLSAVAYVLFCIAFYQFTLRTMRNTLPALHISVGWIYSAGIVAFALLALVAVVNLVTRREPS